MVVSSRPLRWRSLVPLVLAAALTLPGVAHADPATPSWQQFEDSRTGMLKKLAEPVLNCTRKKDDIAADSPIFHGCYDWHSAAHGHYALYATYLATHDKKYLDAAEKQIQPAGDPGVVARELKYMQDGSIGEDTADSPYGMAWLLETERAREQATGTRATRPLADEAVKQIKSWLADGNAEQNLFYDMHSNLSWTLQTLAGWAQYTGDNALLSSVRADVSKYLKTDQADQKCAKALPGELSGELEPKSDITENGFLAPCLMRLAAVAKAGGPGTAEWVSRRLPKDVSVSLLTDPRSAHSAGLNFSRANALWEIYQTTRDSAVRDGFVKLVTAEVTRPQDWDTTSDYLNSHWIAQFGIRAIDQTFTHTEQIR